MELESYEVRICSTKNIPEPLLILFLLFDTFFVWPIIEDGAMVADKWVVVAGSRLTQESVAACDGIMSVTFKYRYKFF